jgi:hypothetical protein
MKNKIFAYLFLSIFATSSFSFDNKLSIVINKLEMSKMKGGDPEDCEKGVGITAALVVGGFWVPGLWFVAAIAGAITAGECSNGSGDNGGGSGYNDPCPYGGSSEEYSTCQQIGGRILGMTQDGRSACCEY